MTCSVTTLPGDEPPCTDDGMSASLMQGMSIPETLERYWAQAETQAPSTSLNAADDDQEARPAKRSKK